MIIANPIYDVVFKRMMENERVAKFFIGTLLDETIEAIEVQPQEYTYPKELTGLAVFRLDYIATIKTKSGEHKKVLIEIQKVKNYIDLMRFRRYLASQYQKEDTVDGKKMILPITTIYILGFILPEVAAACLKVERNYKDLVNNKVISTKSDFVEKLTHDSFIVQVDRITNRYQTRLDKLLSVFEQSNFTDDRKITKEFTHELDSEDIKLTTDVLHYAGTATEERNQLEIEQEAWRTVNAMFEGKDQELMEAIEKSKKEIAEKDKTIEENEKALSDMARQLEELKRQLGKK